MRDAAAGGERSAGGDDWRDVAVLVALRAPPLGRDARALPVRRAEMMRRRTALLATLPSDDVQVEHSYETVPGFTARVTAAGLERLAANPDVLRVDADPTGRTASGNGVAQIRADRVQARGVTG